MTKTIKQSLIEWLQLFDGFEIQDFIKTDIAKEGGGFAVTKEPNQVLEEFNDGSMILQEYYTFVAKLQTVTETQRKNNDSFMENFQDWILKKNSEYDLPNLKEKCYCNNIAISSSYYLESNENKLGMYIFTIEIEYRKEL